MSNENKAFIEALAKKRKELGSTKALAKELGCGEQVILNVFYRKTFGTGLYDVVVARWPEMGKLLDRTLVRPSTLKTRVNKKERQEAPPEKLNGQTEAPQNTKDYGITQGFIRDAFMIGAVMGQLSQQPNGPLWVACLERLERMGLNLRDAVAQLKTSIEG